MNVGMKKCPACGKETLIESNDIRYCSDGCGFVQEINSPESTKWLLTISENKEYWKNEFFEKLPVFIAHEYRRLWLMTCRPNVFCMVYQLKDVGEILLKFPVLCAAAYLNDDAVSSLLVKKVLSIGDWKDIASTLIGKYNGKPRFKLPECLRNILTGIKKIYDQTDIAYYRNDYLAHGAMGFEDNTGYREFGEKLISRISAYFTDVMQDYAQLKVTLGGKDLAGWKLPDDCSPDDELTLHIEGREIPLYPYIANNEKEGVLFFDYYNASRNNQIAKGLNYIRGGGRKSFVAPYYCEIYERHFGGEIQKISDSMNKSLERNNSTLEIEKVLNELNEADNFVRPEYIIHWVENWLNDDKGSIHLLMMERGMGKTALSHALSSGKVDPSDVTVCAYYCGQSAMRSDYISGINNALMGDIVRVQNRRMSHGQLEESDDFIRLKYDAEDKRANMVETLDYFRDEHASFHQKSKLMLIIDGVDELPQESAGLFEYIPRPEEMPDNTYILITSRNPVKEKLPAHISGAIEQLIGFDTMCVNSDIKADNGEKNHGVLKDYATTKVRLLDSGEMRKLSEDESEYLIKLSGGIFLNLKLYAKLAESGIPVKNLPALDSQALFEKYIGEIRKYYGDKLFDEAITVLYAIVTAEEPLTLREVAWLSGEEHITPKLLAFLRDFGALLRTVRMQSDIEVAVHNPRGSLINPASEQYTRYIIALFPEKQKELAAIFTDKLTEVDLEQYSDGKGHYSIPDGLFYMAAYLPTVTNEISEKLRDRIFSEDNDVTTIIKCLNKDSRLYDSYFLRRMAKTGESWSKYCETVGWYSHQIEYLASSFEYSRILCEYDKALDSANNAVRLCRGYLENGRIRDKNLLASTLLQRGIVYKRLAEYEKELSDKAECISIREALFQDKKLKDENKLASAYHGRSITYYSLGKVERALEDCNRSISIRERLFRENKLEDESWLAYSYISRSRYYSNLEEREKALEDVNNGIAIYERMYNSGTLDNDDELAVAYLQKTFLYNGMNKLDKASEYALKAIKIREQLYSKGRMHDVKRLAQAYKEYAECQWKSDGKLAIHYADRAIEIFKSIYEKGMLFSLSDYADALYVKCAVVGLNEPDKAIEIAEEGIKILQSKKKRSCSENESLEVLYDIKKLHEKLAEQLLAERLKELAEKKLFHDSDTTNSTETSEDSHP